MFRNWWRGAAGSTSMEAEDLPLGLPARACCDAAREGSRSVCIASSTRAAQIRGRWCLAQEFGLMKTSEPCVALEELLLAGPPDKIESQPGRRTALETGFPSVDLVHRHALHKEEQGKTEIEIIDCRLDEIEKRGEGLEDGSSRLTRTCMAVSWWKRKKKKRDTERVQAVL